ncbi:phosphotransferase enzyme family protein [Colletotrichum plurivorum]|uniref:Phosphotransferase enzyme family protein n=1 Tax=Colletotrichum plurivorum TaxID=2175906 RepID=A0A8H6N7G9_9PEZI|nr:phosphotransferase enzyme family protein [Colletotrichum plurivorum]
MLSHAEFQDRLDFVRNVIVNFGLQPTTITPLEYDENSPFEYNNFIYKISLASPASGPCLANPGPYTVPLPDAGTSTLIMRVANPRAGVVEDNRVENEVAAIHLARQGVLSYKPSAAFLIPELYAWRSQTGAEKGLGWTLMEYKPGVPLDAKFRDMSAEDQEEVIGQIADAFAGIQRAPIPESVRSHGGLTIDEDGRIVSGQMTILSGGPWNSHEDFWRAKFGAQLREAGRSSVLEGWKPRGVRERVDKFVADGLEGYVASSGADATLVLIHGDFTTNNIQYDPDTKRVTGVLDFDWAYVSHPCHEFFYSLGDVGGTTGGGTSRDPDRSGGRIGRAMMTGDFDSISDLPEEAAGQLAIAKAWDAALAERGAIRPSSVAGIEALDRLRRLESLLCSFALCHPVLLKRKTEEEIKEMRSKAEGELVECLEGLGY